MTGQSGMVRTLSSCLSKCWPGVGSINTCWGGLAAREGWRGKLDLRRHFSCSLDRQDWWREGRESGSCGQSRPWGRIPQLTPIEVFLVKRKEMFRCITLGSLIYFFSSNKILPFLFPLYCFPSSKKKKIFHYIFLVSLICSFNSNRNLIFFFLYNCLLFLKG